MTLRGSLLARSSSDSSESPSVLALPETLLPEVDNPYTFTWGQHPSPSAPAAASAAMSSRRQAEACDCPERCPDVLTWTERHLWIGGEPMRVPAPVRELYRQDAPLVVVMKGAQMGISEWVLDLCFYTADVGRARRGNSLYVQPGGSNVGDFVRGRVYPIIEQSAWLTERIGGADADKQVNNVGMQRLGRGQCFWRTAYVKGRGARNTAGLKSTPADTLILDEYDEMPPGTLALAKHRLDSSAAPWTRIISTPTFPGTGIEPEYLAGDQRRYFLTCPECDTAQPLDWDKNVEEGPDDRRIRVCVQCRESLEATIEAAWTDESLGEWRATNPEGAHPSYHISQLYRPRIDLDAIAEGLASSDNTKRQEAHNQHLGLPYSPPGGQLSLEELRRASTPDFRLADIAGVRDCWMGVDIGARIHVWVEHAASVADHDGLQRVLVGAFEVEHFEDLDDLMRRFGVVMAVVDARPELRMAQAFQRRHPGRVYLAEYVADRMPPLVLGEHEEDPKRRFHVQVDRTAAMDAFAANIRDLRVLMPEDAESVPGLWSMLQAPVRQLKTTPTDPNPRAVYDEGAKADHYYHAGVYAELALYIAQQVRPVNYVDGRQFHHLTPQA